jgi:hypothetical protein
MSRIRFDEVVIDCADPRALAKSLDADKDGTACEVSK